MDFFGSNLSYLIKSPSSSAKEGLGHDPCRTRTCNQLIKSQLLCQIELTGRMRRYYTLKVRLVNLKPTP
jgi:hypothetical protein